MNPSTSAQRVARPALLIAGILLIATNLRAPFTGVAPLLDLIRDSFQLSRTATGMLITLPLLAFAMVSPFAASLARRFGLERSIFAALCLIGGGILLRSAGSAACLFLGTAVIGSGIAIGNVLLPSLLKRDFPERIATLTAVYALTMGVSAAAISTTAIPLAHWSGMGWRFAIGTLVLLPVLSALLWLPQLRNRTAPAATASLAQGSGVWRSALAWQVTLYLGLNSFVYYVVVSWLPAILSDAGFSAQEAGAQHGLLQLATAVPGFVLVPIARKLKDQRLAACSASIISLIGLIGLIFLPAWATVWNIFFGLGTGASIILGLTFVSLRANNTLQAAALSGMAQSVGYLLAAVGPTLVGGLHDALGGWNAALGLCAVLCAVMAGFGLLAGRAIHIAQP